jgi:hypothetical protein
MHNETKVNTEISEVATLEAKNSIFARKHVGILETPYGTLLINSGEAVDHADMCAGQLHGLLMLMQGDGLARFRDDLNETAQSNLFWLAQQLAGQLSDMIRVVHADARGVSA